MPGFIRISRDLFDDPSFASVKFSRPMALIDIIQMARYKAGTEFVNGRPVQLERGQLCKSVRWLASRWKWDEKTVSSFISSLEIGGVITKKLPHSRGGLTSIISIVNYDCFDDDSHTDSHSTSNTDSHAPSHTLYIEKENKVTKNEEKKEGDTAVSPKKERVDYNLVKKTWNDSMTRKVPKIQGLSEARKEKVKVRVEEMGGWDEAQAILRDCFKKVNDSDFCNGANDHQWVATFDWFFSNDKNWMKVSEGNYDNKRQTSRFEQSIGVAQRAKNLIGLIYGTGNTGTTDGFADSPDEQ